MTINSHSLFLSPVPVSSIDFVVEPVYFFREIFPLSFIRFFFFLRRIITRRFDMTNKAARVSALREAANSLSKEQ